MFDRSLLRIKQLKERKHDIDLNIVKCLNKHPLASIRKEIQSIARNIIQAKKRNSSIILFIGGHVIRSGVQNYLIDLMRRGYITCLAMNGACIIHDFEFALIGATTESVAYYIRRGEFGLWEETAFVNNVINEAYIKNKAIGMGYAIGRAIVEGDFPHQNISLLATAYNLNIPATVHVGIGSDIIHEHPNCNGAATGALSYNDFLTFTAAIQDLEGGVIMNLGSAVTGPEVYLKALSMARNVAHQRGKCIKHFSTFVCDLHDLPSNLKQEAPRGNFEYYFRPWKTMLVRTVGDGGNSFYVKGKHADTIPALWSAIDYVERGQLNENTDS